MGIEFKSNTTKAVISGSDGTPVDISENNELQVRDDDANTSLDNLELEAADINTNLESIDAELVIANVSLDSIDDKLTVVNIRDLDENQDSVQIGSVQYNAGQSGVDSITNVLEVIQYEHHEIHSGSSFLTGDYFSLTNKASRDILITTPDTTKWAHFIFKIQSQAEASFILYEDSEVSANGTSLLAFNRNRNSLTAPTTMTYEDPTVTDVGDMLGAGTMGSGKAAGGLIRDSNEIVLRQNTNYIFRITNETTSTNNIDFEFDWYEHTNKN